MNSEYLSPASKQEPPLNFHRFVTKKKKMKKITLTQVWRSGP